MPYATLQNLVDRWGNGPLTQLTNPGGPSIDTTVLARAQAASEAIINSALQRRFTLPLTAPYPPLLVQIDEVFVWYFLHDEQPTEHAKYQYEDMRRLLRAISKSEIDIGLDGAGTAEVSAGSLMSIRSGERIFSRGEA